MIYIFLFFFLLASNVFGQTNTPEELYSRALEYYNAGEFDNSIKLLNELLRNGNTNKYIYASLIDAYISKMRSSREREEYYNILKEATYNARVAFKLYPDDKQIIYKYLLLLDEIPDYEKMKEPLRKLVEIDSNDIMGNFYLGVIELKDRNYKNAENYFLNVVNFGAFIDKMDYFVLYKSLFNLGQLEIEKMNFFKAIKYFEQAENIFSNDYALFINLGICYAEVLDFTNALKMFDRLPIFLWTGALYEIYAGLLFVTEDKRLSNFVEKYAGETPYVEALSLYNSGKFEESLEVLKNYVKNTPAPHFYIHYLFYKLYEKTRNTEMLNKEALLISEKAKVSGKIDMAIDYCKIIEKNNGGIPLIYWMIGDLYNDKDDLTNALKYYQKYVSHPKSKENLVIANLKIAYIYYQRNEKKKAMEYLRVAEEKSGKNEERYLIHFYKGLMLFEERKLDEAIKEFEKASRISKNDAKLYFFVGASYFEKSDRKEAIKYLEKALLIDENDPEINNLLAYSYALEKINLDKALRLIDNALSYKPDNLAYLDTKGWIYYQLENYEKSFEIFNRVEVIIQNTNENLKGFDEIYYHLSKIYEKMGNTKESKRYRKKISELFPESKWGKLD